MYSPAAKDVSTVEALLMGHEVPTTDLDSLGPAVQQLLHAWQPTPPTLSLGQRDAVDSAFHGKKTEGVPGVDGLLRGTWHLNTFELDRVTGGNCLSTLLLWLFDQGGLLVCLGLERDRFVEFCSAVQDGYRECAYHNTRHVASVLHLTHMILTEGGVAEAAREEWRPVVLAVAYIAAATHDVGHEGLTNDFLCRSGAELSTRYHQTSCNEHHHVDVALRLFDEMLAPSLSEGVTEYMRTVMIRMVLASDLARHGEICRNFEAQSDAGCWQASNATILTLQMTLKCADLGHLTLPRGLHLCWVAALQEELGRQGEEERRLRLSPSPLTGQSAVLRSQPRFFDDVALPMYRSLTAAFPACQRLTEGAQSNRDFWHDAFA